MKATQKNVEDSERYMEYQRFSQKQTCAISLWSSWLPPVLVKKKLVLDDDDETPRGRVGLAQTAQPHRSVSHPAQAAKHPANETEAHRTRRLRP